MTAQFLGYLHHNKYRNDFNIVGATSEVDYDFKKLDTLYRELEEIYSQDGFVVSLNIPAGTRDAAAFDLLVKQLKDEAQFWLDKHGDISSAYLACSPNATASTYDDAAAYINDVVDRVTNMAERDDCQFEWECFTESLQYLLDELLAKAAARHPDLPAPTHVIVQARNIDWRGRSGALVCEAKAETLLRKITGSHNSPSYTFYWGEQQVGVDDFGEAFAVSACEFLHMVMPHHDATTHADISPVWHANVYDSDDYIDEDDLPAARKRHAALLSIAERIYGEDRYDRIYSEKSVRPRIYGLVGFDSRSFVDADMKIISERCAADHIDSLTSDLWFWVRHNYDESAETRRFCDELVHRDASFHAIHIEAFCEAYVTAIEMIESDDAAQDNNE